MTASILNFENRLSQANKATGLPPSARLDLADSTLTDDDVDYYSQMFGAPDHGGFGVSDVMNEMLSQDPATIPVSDITTIQQGLIAQGYANGVGADGKWSPYWNTVFRRSQRDAFETARSGKHFGSTPVQSMLKYMGMTVPSSVFQSLVGAAKGFIEQTPETLARLPESAVTGGLVGGAAVGAGTGAIVGSIVPVFGTGIGAIVGGVAGGAIGFIGSLFHRSDESEENQDWLHTFWDALSPYDEYKQGKAKEFFEDLGYIATAASMLTGGGAAAEGAATLKGAGGVAKSLELAKVGSIRPGIFAHFAKEAVARPMVGGAVVGAAAGFVEGGAQGAVQGAVAGGLTGGVGAKLQTGKWGAKVFAEQGDEVLGFFGKYGLRRLESAPLVKGSQQIYTGASMIGMGGRLFGGFGGGEDIYDPKGRLVKDVRSTTIGEAIEEGPELPDFVKTPLDWGVGLILYPSQLLPFSARGVSKTINEVANSNLMLPFARMAQKSGKSVSDAYKEADGWMSAMPNGTVSPTIKGLRMQKTYLEHGIDMEINKIVKAELGPDVPWWEYDKIVMEKRSSLKRQMLDEAGLRGTDDVVGAIDTSPTAKRLYGEATKDLTTMEGFLERMSGVGSGGQFLPDHFTADEMLQDLTSTMKPDAGLIPPSVNEVRITALRKKATERTAQARRLRDEMKKEPGLTIDQRLAKEEEARKLVREARQIRDEIKRGKMKDQPWSLTPALRHDTENRVRGYQTRQDVQKASDSYQSASKRYQEAYDFARKNPDDPMAREAVRNAGKELDTVLHDLRFRGLIQTDEHINLRAPFHDWKVTERLDEIAESRLPEIPEATAALKDKGIDRYVAVATGEDMLHYRDTEHLLEATGVNDLTRRESFYEHMRMLGVGVKKEVDDNLQNLRFNSISGELHQLAGEAKLPLTGREMSERLSKYLRELYDPEAAISRGETISTRRVWVYRGKLGDEAKREFFKVDVRDLSPEDLVNAFRLDEMPGVAEPFVLANKIKAALHRGAAFGAEAQLSLNPIQQARALGRNLRLNGLAGFNDYMRTIHLDFIQKKFPEKSFGYLPDNLHRMSMFLRYTLSPAFDLGRYVEQNMVGAFKAELPIIVSPTKFLERRTWDRSPYASGPVKGLEARQHAMRFYDDQIMGKRILGPIDELDARMTQRGLFGFSPRQMEAAQAWTLYQRGMDPDEIKEIVLQLGRYGTGRTPLEKTVNFIFFPFSFQKKLVTSLGDFAFSAPVRNLMIHEGMRRWYQLNEQGESLSQQWNEYMDKHLPILDQVKKLNNLSYGVGPGRFLFEGIKDRDEVGAVTQAVTAFFVPSGANQPLQATAGKIADAFKHLFVPIVITDDSPHEEVVAALDNFIPAVRDAQAFFDSLGQQVKALPAETAGMPFVGEGAAPYYQLQEYMDGKRQIKAKWEPLALAMGYQSVDGFLNSPNGAAIKAQVDAEEAGLRDQYPSGVELSTSFVTAGSYKEDAIRHISEKQDRSEAEDLILEVASKEFAAKSLAELTNQSQETVMGFMAGQIREFALSHVDNEEFVTMYDKLFAATLGPIRQVSVG